MARELNKAVLNTLLGLCLHDGTGYNFLLGVTSTETKGVVMTQEKKVSFLLNYCHISPFGLLTRLALAFCFLSWSQTPPPCPQLRVASPAPGLGLFQKQ